MVVPVQDTYCTALIVLIPGSIVWDTYCNEDSTNRNVDARAAEKSTWYSTV